MAWFHTREVARGVWLVAEPCHVNSWLVVGRERAALIDTGLGIAPIRPIIEAITDRPIVVINTHHHLDHVGGNHEFDEILIYRDGAPLLERGVPPQVLAAYVKHTQALIAARDGALRADRRYLHALTADNTPRDLPPDFAASRWTIRLSSASGVLEEDDVIDLGGRSLRVLHTPGHSPDCLCLLDEHDGLLFGGDTINTGPIYAHLAESDLALFARSARRLAAFDAELRLVLVHHFAPVTIDPRFLIEVADGLESVVGGEVPSAPAVDCIGEPVRETVFDRFSVYTLDPAHEYTPLVSDRERPHDPDPRRS